MRDISPAERDVLERASRHVEVFERKPLEKDRPLFEPGCFDCDHAVGPLSHARGQRYCTMQLQNLSNLNYDPSVVDFGAVVSFQDRFFVGKSHWLPKYAGSSEYPTAYISYHMVDELLSMGSELYVRLYYTPETGVRHVNSRVNPFELMDADANDEVSLMTSPFYKSFLYFEPGISTATAPGFKIPTDAVRVHPSRESYMMFAQNTWGNPSRMNLIEIKGENDKGNVKKKKVTAQMWPGESANAPNWALTNEPPTAITFNTFEEDDS